MQENITWLFFLNTVLLLVLYNWQLFQHTG